jgi:hypothetical protein
MLCCKIGKILLQCVCVAVTICIYTSNFNFDNTLQQRLAESRLMLILLVTLKAHICNKLFRFYLNF